MNECATCHKMKPWKNFWSGKSKVLRKSCNACLYRERNRKKRNKMKGVPTTYRPRNPVTVRQMTPEERQRAFG